MAERVAHLLADPPRRRARAPTVRDRDDGDRSTPPCRWRPTTAASRRPAGATSRHRLRAGDLRALVATASLELGIDVGPVELVCQIGSPRAIATFLQRVGRANHHAGGHARPGRLYPLTRDELVECTALLAAVRAGHLDVLAPAGGPARRPGPAARGRGGGGREWDVDELFDLVRRAAPYADLDPGGLRRGGRARVVGHPDRARAGGAPTSTTTRSTAGCGPARGARLAALTSGGAIPETGDYRVVLDPDGVTVGSVHEDFAVEATAGDIFLLGTHSWRVRQGRDRAPCGWSTPATRRRPSPSGSARRRPAPPSCPRRSATSAPRVEPLLAAGDRRRGPAPVVAPGPGSPTRWPTRWSPTWPPGRAALGALPTRDRLVVERFFDDAEGTQLIVHSPYGGRINRALGLALRKRFCVSFDFELQAAADDDTVVLSLGPQHSFPLPQVPKMLPSATAPRRPGPGRAAPSDAGRPVAVEPQPGAGRPPVARRASAGPSTSSGWRPRTCWPPPGRRWPPARRTPRPVRSRCPTTCSCARRSTTA